MKSSNVARSKNINKGSIDYLSWLQRLFDHTLNFLVIFLVNFWDIRVLGTSNKLLILYLALQVTLLITFFLSILDKTVCCFIFTSLIMYSRVHKSSVSFFSKILEKPSIVQKKMIPHINGLHFSMRWSKKNQLKNSKWPPQKNLIFQLRQFSIFFHENFMD